MQQCACCRGQSVIPSDLHDHDHLWWSLATHWRHVLWCLEKHDSHVASNGFCFYVEPSQTCTMICTFLEHQFRLHHGDKTELSNTRAHSLTFLSRLALLSSFLLPTRPQKRPGVLNGLLVDVWWTWPGTTVHVSIFYRADKVSMLISCPLNFVVVDSILASVMPHNWISYHQLYYILSTTNTATIFNVIHD